MKFFFRCVLLILLLPGLAVSVYRCMLRTVAESRNLYVETVVDFEEMRQLAREEGMNLPDLFEKLYKSGASSVAITEDTLYSLESEGKITVLNSSQLRKMLIDDGLQLSIPAGIQAPGALWVHAESFELLDRIERHLSWKLPNERLLRLHRNLLMINKSSEGFKKRVGLGFSTEYFDKATEAGLGVVVRVFNYPGLDSETALKNISSIPSPSEVSVLLFAEEEMLGARGDLGAVVDIFRDRSYRIGWVEFNVQEGIRSYLDGLSESRPFVLVHSISRKEIDKNYNIDGAKARWLRAVKERSIRTLYIRSFFQDDKRFIENLVDFNLEYLKELKIALTDAGFYIARNHTQRMSEPRHLLGRLSYPEMISIATGLMLGFPLLLKFSVFPDLRLKWFFIVIALTFGFSVILPKSSFFVLAGLTGAVCWATVGPVMAFTWLSKKSHLRFLRLIFAFSIIIVLPSLIGGVLIAGLHSETEYLLKYSQFRGIKLSLMLPVILTFFWSLKLHGKGAINLLTKPLNGISMLLGIFLAGALLLFMIRSGNVTFLRAHPLEQSFRNYLEQALVARPRTKEIFIGYPAIFAFLFFYIKKQYAILPLLAVMIQIGQTSVINTMCHFHTPVALSLLRIFNGYWFGMSVGIIILPAIILIHLLFCIDIKRKNEIVLLGYFGFSNYGDELLRIVFSQRFLSIKTDYKISVLSKKHIETGLRVDVIYRNDFISIIESLLTAKALVIPGGGIFQSATSLRSLIYYLLFIKTARSIGCQTMLLSQGLGPWNGMDKKYPLIFRHLFIELRKAHHLSFRDPHSEEMFKKATGAKKTSLSADLSFLYNAGKVVKGSSSEIKEDLKVVVVIRGNCKHADRIASEICQMNEEIENLRIVPLALDLKEDISVWNRVNYKEKVIEEIPDFESESFNDVDIVISMRLHGCIIATIKKIPWIGISYDPKISALASQAGWQYCFEPEQIDKNILEESINQIISQKAQLAVKLENFSKNNKRKVEKDFNRFCSKLD